MTDHRQAIQRAFDNIGQAIDCWNDYMPVDYDGVRRTRHGLEQSYSELAAILGRPSAESIARMNAFFKQVLDEAKKDQQ